MAKSSKIATFPCDCRVSIPPYMRRAIRLKPGDMIRVIVDKSSIIITPVNQLCVFCDKPIGVDEPKGQINNLIICEQCINIIKEW